MLSIWQVWLPCRIEGLIDPLWCQRTGGRQSVWRRPATRAVGRRAARHCGRKKSRTYYLTCSMSIISFILVLTNIYGEKVLPPPEGRGLKGLLGAGWNEKRLYKWNNSHLEEQPNTVHHHFKWLWCSLGKLNHQIVKRKRKKPYQSGIVVVWFYRWGGNWAIDPLLLLSSVAEPHPHHFLFHRQLLRDHSDFLRVWFGIL